MMFANPGRLRKVSLLKSIHSFPTPAASGLLPVADRGSANLEIVKEIVNPTNPNPKLKSWDLGLMYSTITSFFCCSTAQLAYVTFTLSALGPKDVSFL